MQKQSPLIWLPMSAWMRMIDESNDKAPKETGGVLIGYWNDRRDEAVIENVIGPGPNAEHNICSFRPDQDFQEAEIARHYMESESLHVYLGDWHSHPTGDLAMSSTDRKTLRRIALCRESRIPVPIMGILAGAEEWRLKFWSYRPTALGKLGIRIGIEEALIRKY